MYDSIKARAAQKEYCATNDAPHFAPYDGRCYSCNQDIYSENGNVKFGPLGRQKPTGHTRHGITVEEAGSTLVTGCPFCNASYCE